MLQPVSSLYSEVGYVAPAAARRISALGRRRDGQVTTPGSLHAALFSFTLQPVGGVSWLAASGLAWHIQNGAVGMLDLFETRGSARLQVQFPGQLFPGVTLIASPSGGRASLVGITADGSLFCLDLEHQPGTGGLGLGSVHPRHVRYVDISSQWSTLGAPTQITSAGEVLAVAGANGSVLCLPCRALLDASSSQQLSQALVTGASGGQHPQPGGGAFLLRESSWGIKSMVASMVWQRGHTASVVSLLPLPPPHAGTLLVLYDDGTLRGFNLDKQAQIFADHLPCCHQPKRHAPVFAAITTHPEASGELEAVLTVQVEAPETSKRSVHVITLHFHAAASAKPHVRQHLTLTSHAGATLLAAHAVGSAVWTLYRQSDGGSALLRYTLTGDGTAAGAAALLESHHLPVPGTTVPGGGGVDVVSLDLWQELLYAAAETMGSGPEGAEQLACAQVSGRLLVPGAVYRDALGAALKQHGITAAPTELSGAGAQQLQQLLSAAVDGIQRRSSGLPRVRCWAQLLGSYQDAWSRQHTLLGLSASPTAPGQVLTVRGGGALGVLRHATPLEALAAPAVLLSDALDDTVAHEHSLVTLPAPVQTVHDAARQVAALLGPWALDAACSALLLAGIHPSRELAPLLVRLVLDGTPPGHGYLDALAQEARARWRAARRTALLELGTALSGLREVHTAVREYCSLLDLAAVAPSRRSERQAAGTLPPLSVVQSARQVAASQASACSATLLLLQLAGDLQLAGGALANAGLVRNLVPGISDELQRAGLVHWLTGTPANPGTSGVQPALSALAALNLGQPRGGGSEAATPVSTGQSHTLESSLAARLLAQGGLAAPGADLQRAAIAAALQLQYTSTGRASVAEQCLLLGYQLFAAQEAGALTGLTQLCSGLRRAGSSAGVGGGATSTNNDADMHLLQGLGLACTLRQVPAAQRPAAVASASAAFFRAAAGLHAGANPLLARVIAALTQYLVGGSATVAPDTTDAAASAASAPDVRALQLQLYEAALQVFEREGAPEGALAFAQAAIQHCAACGDTDVARAGRLWSNVFAFSCQLGAWSDAYAALLSNPDTAQAVDCLRRLIYELCEGGHLAALCALPLAGVLRVPAAAGGEEDGAEQDAGMGMESPRSVARTPALSVVSLRAEAIAALQRRAINSDLGVVPQPYWVLYDFLVTRGELREAAAAMLGYARRLRAEGPRSPATYQETRRAYELAVHCLCVLPRGDAWLDDSTSWLSAHPRTHSAAGGGALFAAGSEGAGDAPSGCITAADVQQELAVVSAAITAATSGAAAGMDPLQHPLNPSEVLAQLLLAGQYDAAQQLVCSGWRAGSTGALDAWAQLVGALADSAARAQLKGVSAVPQPLALLSRDPQEQQLLLGAGHMASPAAPLWNKLRHVLSSFLPPAADTASPAAPSVPRGWGDVLRVAAAQAVLRVERRMALPMWLLQTFTEGGDARAGGMAVAHCGPASLLDVYLAHDRLGDSVTLVVTCLDDWGTVDPRTRRHHAATWFPHTRVKALRGRLVTEVDRGSEACAALLEQLDAALLRHADLLAQDTTLTTSSMRT